MSQPVELPITEVWDQRQRRWFRKLARTLATTDDLRDFDTILKSLPQLDPGADALPLAASRVLFDLARQGWRVAVDRNRLSVEPPAQSDDIDEQKRRVRAQELLTRDAQLAKPSVRRFAAHMERPTVFNARPVSIRSVIRDGPSLAHALQNCDPARPESMFDVMSPYLQVVTEGSRCDQTGLRLIDIWRYFRHGWTNQYVTTPGRTMLMLVRDAAHPGHPVIGIAALGSAVVQIAERDRWLGWEPNSFLMGIAEEPTIEMASWFRKRLNQLTDEIYIADLLEDGTLLPTSLRDPTRELIASLRREAALRREDHRRFADQRDLKTATPEGFDWTARARTDLYRGKRSGLLADLLGARLELQNFMRNPSTDTLAQAINKRSGRLALLRVIRRTRAERVGNVIADLTVCGAIAPYSPLAAGKLVAMLAVGPSAVRSYNERYGQVASQIASSMAGRPVVRETRIAYVGTTSLYGGSSSQYNRLAMPALTVGGPSDAKLRYVRIGRSRAYGTSHFSDETVTLLSEITGQSLNGVRVNSIFGEGVNPKLRKIRNGLGVLSWPTDELLRHGRERLIYGVPLVENLRDYLIGVDEDPSYLLKIDATNDSESISRWWFERWASKRTQSADVMAAVQRNSLVTGRHGGLLPTLDAARTLL